jgi:hypothetical protein
MSDMIVPLVILLGLVYSTGFAHGTIEGPRGVKLAASITHSCKRLPQTLESIAILIGTVVSIAAGVTTPQAQGVKEDDGEQG